MTHKLQQFFLNGGDRDALSIMKHEHPTLPLIGYEYHQVLSPTYDPVVRAARGTVLERESHKLVARPIERFYNFGQGDVRFDWNNFRCYDKRDGSCIIVFEYGGQWHAKTIGSFGFGPFGSSGKSFQCAFWDAYKSAGGGQMTPGHTYMFELTSFWNQVVVQFGKTDIHLFAVVRNEDGFELDPAAEATRLGVNCVDELPLRTFDTVKQYVETTEQLEGVVVVDGDHNRIKWKTEWYLARHRLVGNNAVCDPKNALPLVLRGQIDDVIAAVPRLKDELLAIKQKVTQEFESLVRAWENTKHIEAQKEFAQAVLKLTPYANVLLAARKNGNTLEALQRTWVNFEKTILRVAFKGT